MEEVKYVKNSIGEVKSVSPDLFESLVHPEDEKWEESTLEEYDAYVVATANAEDKEGEEESPEDEATV